jgi:hypothetical protein
MPTRHDTCVPQNGGATLTPTWHLSFVRSDSPVRRIETAAYPTNGRVELPPAHAAGLITVTRTRQVRGAVEHFYRPAG